MLHTHEAHDARLTTYTTRQVNGHVHVDGDDMTYPPVVRKPLQCHAAGAVADNRTSTQRTDELAAALEFLTRKVNLLERKFDELQGD